VLISRVSSLFRRKNDNNDSQDVPRPRFLEWAKNAFFNPSRRRNDEGIELQEPRTAVVDVPFTRGKHVKTSLFQLGLNLTYITQRNISGAQVRIKKEKENTRNAKNAKNAYASSSRPPQNIVTQQSSGSAVQTSPSSELHAAVSTSSTAPSTAITHWTRFWPAVCCTSAQSTEGHH
jgi:hypothetical protein